MNNVKRKLCFTVSFALLVGSIADGKCAAAEPTDKQIVTIRAEDITGSVQILGTLGQRLGSLITIRGKWISPGVDAKDASPVFAVDLVNGQEIKKSVAFASGQVTSVLGDYDGHGYTPGDTWNWKYSWNGNEPLPIPAAGEMWEVMGVETGAFHDYSAEAWKEMGGPAVQGPSYMRAFYTRLEVIAMKKVK